MEASQNIQDICFRSRQNILRMLDNRGYDTTPYSKFGPDEIAKLITKEKALEMELSHKSDSEKKVYVLYKFTRIKQSLSSLIRTLLDPEEVGLDPKKHEVVVVTMEQIVDTFHAGALEAWNTHSLKIQFFWMPSLVNYPLDHVLQPKFEIVPKEDHPALLTRFYAKRATQFPMIRYHADMVARCLGLSPGDIVKIIRPSPSAGEYELYRTCVP
jgi:DNA-directed RNA polymerase subunit H (RpoH/RPB5)